MPRVPTAAVSAAGLIAGYAVAVATGSRGLGGVVLLVFGLACISVWLRRDGASVATRLAVLGLTAFAVSHLLGLLIGAWPAVLVVAAAMSITCWRVSDAPAIG